VQAALLRVVLERAVGDLTLPDEVAVVAAANPPEQAADGWDLSQPTRLPNRGTLGGEGQQSRSGTIGPDR